MLKLTELQVSSRNHPIGLDEQPVFSWKMVSDIPDTIQTACRVRVGSWDTGRVESGDSLFVPYARAGAAAAHRPPLLPGLDKQNLIAQEDEPVRCVQMLPVVKDFPGPQRGMGAGFRPEHHRRGACQTRSASGGAGAPAPC